MAVLVVSVLGMGLSFGATVDDYVQDGLIAEWDAIDNAGTGVHDAQATVWKDLKGFGGNMPVLTNEVWKDGSCLHFNGSVNTDTYQGNCTNLLAGGDFSSLSSITIEAVVKTLPRQSYGNRWFDAWPHSTTFETYGGRNTSEGFAVKIGSVRHALSATYGLSSRYTFQATYDSATKCVTAAEWRGTCRTANGSAVSSDAVTIPARLQFANAVAAGYEVCAIRIYNRALTEDEMQTNALVDAERFPEYASWGLSDAVMCGVADLAGGYPFRSDVTLVSRSYGKKVSSTITRTDADWAPNAVYAAERYYATLTNTITGLVPCQMYRVDYLGAETYFSAAGKRVFDVMVNGTTVLKDLDLFTAGGGKNRAVTRSFYTPADSQGRIQTVLTRTSDNAKYGGLAVFAGVLPTSPSLRVERIAGTDSAKLVYSAADALTFHVQRAASADGPWTEIACTLKDQTVLTNAIGSADKVFYRVACSNGIGVVTTPVHCLGNRVYALNLGPRVTWVDRFAPSDYLTSTESFVWGGTTSGTVQSTDDLANPIPSSMGGDFLYAQNMTFTLPNLRADKTYRLHLYAVEDSSGSVGSRVFDVAVNGATVETGVDIYARTQLLNKVLELDYDGLVAKADGTLVITLTGTTGSPQLCGLELVEESVGQVPLVPYVQAVNRRMEGNAIAIGVQCADTRFEIQRNAGSGWTTIATNAQNGFIDVGASASANYRARAVNDAGVFSDWSEEKGVATGDSPKKAIRVCHPDLAGTYDGRTYESVFAYGPSSYDHSMSVSSSFDRSLIFEPLPATLYTKAFYSATFSQVYAGLYPNARYRVRLHGFCSGTDVSFTPYVNGEAIFGKITGGLAYGANKPYVFETEAVANPQGTVYLSVESNTSGRQRIFGAELLLEEAGDATGGAYQTTSGVISLNGRLTVPTTGTYAFTKAQGTQGRLFIDDDEVAPLQASGTITLSEGVHSIRARDVGDVTWSGPGVAEQTLGGAYLTHDAALGAGAGDLDVVTLAQTGSVRSGDIRPVVQSDGGETTWRLLASGHDFGGQHDTGFGAGRMVQGKFEAVARIRDVRHEVLYPKVGIMVRTSLEPLKGDYVWFSAIETVGNGYGSSWLWCCDGDDFSDGTAITQKYKADGVGLYTWVRIRRTRTADGDYEMYAGYSKDGTSWTEKSVPCSNTDEVFVGLFGTTTMGSDGAREHWITANVDHFTIKDHPNGLVLFLR